MEREFIFILGNAKELAAFELQSVINQYQKASFNVSENLGFINSTEPEEKLSNLINVLGGTIKIGVLIDKGNWREIVKTDLINNPTRDIGFSAYKGSIKRDDVFEIKNQLKEREIKIRVVFPKDGKILNAAEITNNRLISKGREYMIVNDQVYKTLAVQDIESAHSRDFDKPKANAFSGMLPPKLARMMVNIAANKYQTSPPKGDLPLGGNIQHPGMTVVDPFCGSGNVLMEALDLGYKVQGSDISEKAVEWTQINLSWFVDQITPPKGDLPLGGNIKNKKDYHPQPTDYKLFQGDATKDDFLKGISNQFVIVAEPFLGKPKKGPVDSREADRELEQLEKMYIGFFENLKSLTGMSKYFSSEAKRSREVLDSSLRQPADRTIINLPIVCLVFPVIELKNGESEHLYSRIVDKINSFGYIKLAGPFVYGRDYQVVKREIVLFKLI